MTNAAVPVVIPAYNEEATIRAVAGAVRDVTPEVIVVNDGSTDGTAAQLDGLDVTVIELPVNIGKAGALIRGFQEALTDPSAVGVVTLDGDGQHRAEDVRHMIDAGRDAPERIIIGSRMWDAERFPKGRLRANRCANFWISWAAGYPIDDSQSGFRFYPAALLGKLDLETMTGRGFVFESEVLIAAAHMGITSKSIRIPALYDAQGLRPSHFRPVADIAKIVRMVSWKLISRGMYPAGLWRSLRRRRARS